MVGVERAPSRRRRARPAGQRTSPPHPPATAVPRGAGRLRRTRPVIPTGAKDLLPRRRRSFGRFPNRSEIRRSGAQGAQGGSTHRGWGAGRGASANGDRCRGARANPGGPGRRLSASAAARRRRQRSGLHLVAGGDRGAVAQGGRDHRGAGAAASLANCPGAHSPCRGSGKVASSRSQPSPSAPSARTARAVSTRSSRRVGFTRTSAANPSPPVRNRVLRSCQARSGSTRSGRRAGSASSSAAKTHGPGQPVGAVRA